MYGVNSITKIYQSCLAAFLTFASKSCGPSYAAKQPSIITNPQTKFAEEEGEETDKSIKAPLREGHLMEAG